MIFSDMFDGSYFADKTIDKIPEMKIKAKFTFLINLLFERTAVN